MKGFTFFLAGMVFGTFAMATVNSWEIAKLRRRQHVAPDPPDKITEVIPDGVGKE